jgi:hypothetical protein
MNSSHPGPYAAIPLWLRPITRRPGEVQFGVLEGGPIVSGVTPDEARLLARLDGTMPPEAVGLVARASGVSKRRWRALLDLVVRLGLLEPVPAARSEQPPTVGGQPASPGSHVLIEGDGSLADDLRRLLGSDSVGWVGSVGTESEGDESGSEAAQPGVVVLVADIALDPRRGDLWLRRGVPHLPVVTTGSRAVVGPLVDSAAESPCLWCLDLHRTDRDAAWPTVMTQVATVPVDSGAAQPEPHRRPVPVRPSEPGLSQLVAGTVAALVARSAVGDPPPPGVAVEVSLPWPRLDHRRWRLHPRCRQHASRTGVASSSEARRDGSGAA